MRTLLLFAMLIFPQQLFTQVVPDSTDDLQYPDTLYNPPIVSPAYPGGKGPVVFIDEGHHNYHTMENRYKPFALLLEKDGYVVEGYRGEFTRMGLNAGKVLVIANALNGSNVDRMFLPTPSAFTKDEIEAVREWVSDGGSLFLIADHMPWPGANAVLASVFGFTFTNGFNFDVINPSFFRRSDKTIRDNVITRGRDAGERVNEIPNTEGQAFRIPAEATPILVFNNSSFLLMPDTAWVFHENTRMIRIEGWSQGAFRRYGKGRVVVFGEASMFTAQLGQPGLRKMGMNRCDAGDCHLLLLNIMHWLDGIL